MIYICILSYIRKWLSVTEKRERKGNRGMPMDMCLGAGGYRRVVKVRLMATVMHGQMLQSRESADNWEATFRARGV